MRVKAQVAMEYLMIVAFSLLLLIPLLALFSGTFNSDQTFIMNQASEISREIFTAAERTYYQGPGSKQVLSLNVPRGYESVVLREGDEGSRSLKFTTVRGLTVEHTTRIPINLDSEINLAQPGVYTLVIETDGGSQLLDIEDDVVRITRKNG